MPGSTRGVPRFTWKRRFDERTRFAGSPVTLSPRLIVRMFPALVRAGAHMLKEAVRGGESVVARLGLRAHPVMGVPLGGIGGGTITRGWRGDFVRWQMRPGMYDYRLVPADQFSLWSRREGEEPRATVLSPRPRGARAHRAWPDLATSHWGNEKKATYHALYPRAWTVYEEPAPGLTLVCRQVSPVIPHNYVESSYPVGVFVWTVENAGGTGVDVSLMFSFQNGTGGPNDRAGGHSNEAWDEPGGEGATGATGVSLRHVHRMRCRGRVCEDPLTFAIAAGTAEGVEVTRTARFVSQQAAGGFAGVVRRGAPDAAALWRDFAHDGRLGEVAGGGEAPVGEGVAGDAGTGGPDRPSRRGEAIAAAVAAKVHVPAGEARELVFALAWDMPVARFGSGTGWYRRYTRYYGREGRAAPAIARDAIARYPEWEKAIEAWQKPVLDDPGLPDWYKSALFNETYYVTDGGTLWTDGREAAAPGEPRGDWGQAQALGLDPGGFLVEDGDIGHFGYLESHEYLMYNTYDVHFSASFALAMLWPRLELSLQRDFAASVRLEHPETVTFLLSGRRAPRKRRGVVPHDLGAPTEDPWRKLNAYNAQDVGRWKDLNTKFVLQVYRDYLITRDKAFLEEVRGPVDEAMDYMLQFDRDGDGLIENEGFPDQTYDTWPAEGPSAYSGGLWLAALRAAEAIASELGDSVRAATYGSLIARARESYDRRLWNGSYYDYDSSRKPHHDSVMADQLAGQWFVLACGLEPVVPRDRARSVLRKVFELNVMSWTGPGIDVPAGERGAVNGIRPDGRFDSTSMQAEEVWTGTTLSLAAAMLQEGMTDEAFATARGIYLSVYRDFPLWFQTPEAIDIRGVYRAIGYMRPLAIWTIQWEWEKRKRSNSAFTVEH